ncbi:hypothetical protein ACLB2K_072388 [Fragaria x ananassa]
MDSTFAKLWEKSGDQADQIARVVETTQKLDMFFVDKYLRKKDVETRLRESGVNLTYESPFPDYVAGADWPLNYRNILFTPFSGEGSEDAVTHISRFQSECGPYGNDPSLKLRVFGSSLAGSALTWYTKLVPGSIPDWATMERMFRTTFDTVEPEVDLSSLTSMYQQPMKSLVDYLGGGCRSHRN